MTLSSSGPEEWAVVTGATDGIGRAVAVRLARAGANLVLIGRSPEKLSALEAELATLAEQADPALRPGERRFLARDLGDPSAIDEIAALTDGLVVSHLVQAAGFGSSGSFVDLDPETEAAMVDVNCRAVVALTSVFSPRMVERGAGAIVLFSSIVAFQGAGGSATYAATKGFVQSFAEGLRLDLAGSGVNVVSVCPGPTASGFADAAGMSFSGAASVESVADAIVANLERNADLFPGARARALRLALASAPRRLRVRIISAIMRSFTPQGRLA